MPDDLIEVESPAERLARREAPQRVMTETPAPLAIEEEAPVVTPEAALVEARKAITQKDNEIAEARRREQAAQNEIGRARTEAARVHAARATDRVEALTAIATAAAGEKTRAMQAIKMAREAGDLDSEVQAQQDLADATVRVAQANADLEALKQAAPPQNRQEQQPQNQGYSAAAQAWIDRNPRFNTDQSFQDYMKDIHFRAQRDGIKADTPAYFRALDQAAANFDRLGEPRSEGGTMTEPQSTSRPSSSSGAPPSRNNGTAPGSNVVKTLLGPVTVVRSGGKITGIRFPQNNPSVREAFEEGARDCKMTLGDYALDQVKIAEEREAGGTGGLVTGEGSVYR